MYYTSTSLDDGYRNILWNNSWVGGTNFVMFGSITLPRNTNCLGVGRSSFVYSPGIIYDFSGRSVSNAGDVNGDGYEDLIIGAPTIAVCYVLFGTSLGFQNMTEGFTIFGSSDHTGWSVSSAGDVNNDTYSDIIIGAPQARGSSFQSGVACVIYGRQSGFRDVYLNNMLPGQGYAIYGEHTADFCGMSVSSAGNLFI
jgi:hypothetical protein